MPALEAHSYSRHPEPIRHAQGEKAYSISPGVTDLQRMIGNAEAAITRRGGGRSIAVEAPPSLEQYKVELFSKADHRDKIIKERIIRTDAKESFKDKGEGSYTLVYDPDYDLASYADVLKIADPDERIKRLGELEPYIEMQLKTYIGELVVTRISTIHYFLKKDSIGEYKMYGKDCNKSIQDMVRTGQKNRLDPKFANPIDWPREKAEIEEMDIILDLKHSPVGTMKLVFSIPGGRDEDIVEKYKDVFEEIFRLDPERKPEDYMNSSYIHNFYDLFIVKEKLIDGKLKKYIELQRHTYGLSTREVIAKVFELSANPFRKYLSLTEQERKEADIAAILLEDPITISNKTSEELQTFLHKDHTYTSVEDYNYILAATASLRERYIRLLHEIPTESVKNDLYATLNHLINTAVNTKDLLLVIKNYQSKLNIVSQIFERNKQMSRAEIRIVGQEVKVQTGGSACPGKNGKKVPSESGLSDRSPTLASNNSSFSVSEFSGGDCPEIACGRCAWIATSTEAEDVQAGKLTACPNCGWSPGSSSSPEASSKNRNASLDINTVAKKSDIKKSKNLSEIKPEQKSDNKKGESGRREREAVDFAIAA